MIRFSIGIAMILWGSICVAQTGGKIQVLGAKTFEFDQKASGKVNKLIGNVRLKQDRTLLYCDSAYQHEETNYVEAFGHVHINTNDTVHIYSDVLKYDGNTKKARVEKNVSMNDNTMQLTTSDMDYDMNAHTAYYTNGGKIVNGNSVLTSRSGYYNTRDKTFFFKREVVLTTPEYVINSDTLKQNTLTNTTYFLGPTTITSKEDKIYCEYGWYNNVQNLAMFSKNARLNNKDNELRADSIFYDRKIQYGKAYRNIILTDKVNKIEIRGNFGELIGKSKKSYVTQKAFAKKMLQNDSMYLLADTIFSFQKDSVLKQEQLVKAYRNAQILKFDLQSVCDSLVYDYKDSTVTLFHDPIMWSGNNQITSDTVVLFINNNKIDSFHLLNNAFMISRETAKDFNQVKGKNMTGMFENSQFKYIRVYGNGQSIFYPKDEKDSSYIGVNVIDCSEMEFFFEQNKIRRSNFITQPDATFYPIGELKPEELKLKGFKWLVKRRPTLKSVQTYFSKK
jgi:lipopolysaccharide assembly outer membrane protein LptD (OstA)